MMLEKYPLIIIMRHYAWISWHATAGMTFVWHAILCVIHGLKNFMRNTHLPIDGIS